MQKRRHAITETRDWAKIIIAVGTAVAAILTAAKGIVVLLV